MEAALVPGLLVFGVVVATAVAGFGWWQDDRRRRLLVGFCAAEGWGYTARDDSVPSRWRGTPFDTGHNRRSRNVINGVAHGRSFVAFDYSYQTDSRRRGLGADQNGGTQHFAVLGVSLPSWLPTMQIVPASVLSRFEAAIGIGSEIQLESEDFNRRFRVTARQPKFASDVLSPSTMQALLSSPVLAWRIEGAELIAWASGKLDPADLLVRLATVRAVVEGIPDFVWADHGYQDRRYDADAGIVPLPPADEGAA